MIVMNSSNTGIDERPNPKFNKQILYSLKTGIDIPVVKLLPPLETISIPVSVASRSLMIQFLSLSPISPGAHTLKSVLKLK